MAKKTSGKLKAKSPASDKDSKPATAFKIGDKVQWQWLGRAINGVVKEVHTKSISKVIKGKSIKRNGSPQKPAYLVESEAGNLALKLQTELSKSSSQSSRPTPKMFS